MRAFAVLAVLLLLVTPVSASDLLRAQGEEFGVPALEDAVPEDARDALGDATPWQPGDLLQGFSRILTSGLTQGAVFLQSVLTTVLRVLLVVILCQVAHGLTTENGRSAVKAAGALAVLACCTGDLNALTTLAQNTMGDLGAFSNVLVPVMAAAATASGAPTSSGISAALASFCSGLLVNLCQNVLIPGAYGYLALALADSVLWEPRLREIRKLLGKAIEWSMRTLVYGYMALLGVTGLLSGTADAAAVKAAKATLSTVVPVVGGIISGAADTILSGAVVLKSAVGTFGMLSVGAIFVAPFVRLGLFYVGFRLVKALSSMVGSPLDGLFEALAGAFGMILGMVASCSLISFLACCSMMKVVAV